MALAESGGAGGGAIVVALLVDACIVISLIKMANNAPSPAPQTVEPAPISTDPTAPASEALTP